MNTEYQLCTRCVMDSSDPAISFNTQGICNHCREFDEVTSKGWFPNEEGARRLAVMVDQMKAAGKGKPYDCILGLSGGVDSSYLALKVYEQGLRPLVVHVDAGWNSELAVANIEKIVKFCNFDLHTHVVDWEEMRDLQLAFLRSGISNQDVPQDHIFFASIYHYATKHGIKYVLSGGNLATEGIYPKSWTGSAMDAINLHAIHRKFGQRRLKDYKTVSFFDYYLWYPFVKQLRTVRPLNYMPYDKKMAVTELEQKIGWRAYGRKHGESIFTKFFQNYYLPARFGYDKRRPHFSSLIVSGQMSRDEAMEKLSEPLYSPNELEADISYLCKKLGIGRNDFEELILAPQHSYLEYPNWISLQNFIKKMQRLSFRMTGKKITIYS